MTYLLVFWRRVFIFLGGVALIVGFVGVGQFSAVWPALVPFGGGFCGVVGVGVLRRGLGRGVGILWGDCWLFWGY